MAEQMSGIMWQGKPVPTSALENYFANKDNPKQPVIQPWDPNKNMWEQQVGIPTKGGVAQDSRQLDSYFNNPTPPGIAGFSAGANYGKQQLADIYGSQDQKDVMARLKSEADQGLNAQSMASLKAKYGNQGVTEQAKMQKSGLKGMAALRAGEDLARGRREDAAAQDYAIKKQSYDTYRDELGRRTLLSVNLPMAYGQLGSAAAQGQVMQQLAGQGYTNVP